MRNVLSEVLDSVVISHGHFLGDGLNLPLFLVLHLLHLLGHSLHLGLILVFNDLLLEGHVLDPALALDHFLAGVDSGANNLGAADHLGGRFSGNCAANGTADSVRSASSGHDIAALSVSSVEVLDVAALGGVGNSLSVSLSTGSSSIGIGSGRHVVGGRSGDVASVGGVVVSTDELSGLAVNQLAL